MGYHDETITPGDADITTWGEGMARGVNDRGADPLDFEAVGDGSNDTTAVLDAIAALKARGSGRGCLILTANRTYGIEDVIPLHGIGLLCDGVGGPRFKALHDDAMIEVGDGITSDGLAPSLGGFDFDGNGFAATCGVRINLASNRTMRPINVFDCAGDGAQVVALQNSELEMIRSANNGGFGLVWDGGCKNIKALVQLSNNGDGGMTFRQHVPHPTNSAQEVPTAIRIDGLIERDATSTKPMILFEGADRILLDDLKTSSKYRVARFVRTRNLADDGWLSLGSQGPIEWRKGVVKSDDDFGIEAFDPTGDYSADGFIVLSLGNGLTFTLSDLAGIRVGRETRIILGSYLALTSLPMLFQGTTTEVASDGDTDNVQVGATATPKEGGIVTIVAGTGEGQDRTIDTAVAGLITVTDAWDVVPDDTSVVVYDDDAVKLADRCKAAGTGRRRATIDNGAAIDIDALDNSAADYVTILSLDVDDASSFDFSGEVIYDGSSGADLDVLINATGGGSFISWDAEGVIGTAGTAVTDARTPSGFLAGGGHVTVSTVGVSADPDAEAPDKAMRLSFKGRASFTSMPSRPGLVVRARRHANTGTARALPGCVLTLDERPNQAGLY